MKKLLLILSSVLAVIALFAIPLACCHDEDEKDGDKKEDKVLREFVGFVKYGEMLKDSASACLTNKANGSIELTLSTGLPLYKFDFSDVNINLQGDSSILRAQNQTIDTGNDNQFVATLNGFLKDSTLYLVITGNELTQPLYFVTEKSMLKKIVAKDCQADGPSENYIEAYNCEWEGTASFDGAAAVPVTFTSALTDDGDFTIELGACQFADKNPAVLVTLKDMCFFMAEGGFPNFSFSSDSVNTTIRGAKGAYPAAIDGEFQQETLTVKAELTIDKKVHTIEISNARIKE